MRNSCFTIMTVLLVVSAVASDLVIAGDLFFLRQRTRTKSHLPDHNYDHDAWPYTTPRTFSATAFAVAATDPGTSAREIKPFHFRATALTVNHLTLDRVGLALYSDGRLFASGRITHSGGDGGLIGNNVTIRVRAYVAHTAAAAPVLEVPVRDLSRDPVEFLLVTPNGLTRLPLPVQQDLNPSLLATPNDATRIPPDAYVVCSCEHKQWVSRGGPHHILLASEAECRSNREKLAQHFDDITHIEVEFGYQMDR